MQFLKGFILNKPNGTVTELVEVIKKNLASKASEVSNNPKVERLIIIDYEANSEELHHVPTFLHTIITHVFCPGVI